MSSLELDRLVELHMQRRATQEQRDYLYERIEEWRHELIKFLNRHMSRRESYRTKQQTDFQKHAEDKVLQMEAYSAWQEKIRKTSMMIKRAEHDLAIIDQATWEDSKNPPSVRERFLSAAIEAHRDFAMKHGIRSYDESLYHALNGKWTFTEIPEGLPWLESE